MAHDGMPGLIVALKAHHGDGPPMQPEDGHSDTHAAVPAGLPAALKEMYEHCEGGDFEAAAECFMHAQSLADDDGEMDEGAEGDGE